ncbi:MAG: DUF2267 domain-containing protein [Phyllobacterium sp.]|uniref:DUF2267 domain-containing protein n=1 Tax=Phyllobacterium sp. TaxID=1871046 RepID=UPI0030F10072
MTIPMEYRRACEEFERFLADVADASGLTTRHQANTMVEGVLVAFRRRLALEDAIVFVKVLPPMLRALFVKEWDPFEPRSEGWDRALLTREVKALRAHHNLSPRYGHS